MLSGRRALAGLGPARTVHIGKKMEVLLFTLEGHRYGVRKDQVSSVEPVGAVHRLPFLRSSLTVLAVMGDHTSTLADLGPCLGHGPGKGSSVATALVMADQGQLRGFLVGGALSTQEVDAGSVIPMPDFLGISFVESFLSVSGNLVPVVSIRSLFNQILEDGSIPAAQSKALSKTPSSQPGQGPALKVVSAGARLLALRADELQEIPGMHRITRFPLLPPDLDGVTEFDFEVLPVMDLARRVSRRDVENPPLMIGARLESVRFGFLVDSSVGEWSLSDATVKELPFICRTPWLQSAVVRGGQVAAVIDLAALLSAAEDGQDRLSEAYKPLSTFPDAFGKEDVEVTELRVMGRRLAIPRAEVAETIPCVPVHAVPYAPGMMTGVGLLEGEFLPVLDLARIMGQSSHPTAEWRMILVHNGNFQALVLSEKEPETRSLRREIQREVPVHLPYPVVYGCYTEGDSIRLILNIQALALHFDESRAMELLPSLSPVEFTQEVEPGHADEATPQEAALPEAVLPEAAASEEALPQTLSLETVTLDPSQVETAILEPVAVEEEIPETVSAEAPREAEPWVEAVVEQPAPTQAPVEITTQVPTPAAAEVEEMISADETFELAEAPSPWAQNEAPSAPSASKQLEPPEIPEFVGDDEIELTLPEAAAPVPHAVAPTPPPAPSVEEPRESAVELEEERFVEEVRVRKQVVVEQPPHRARRMLVAFVASAILIAGVVVGLYFLGPARPHATVSLAPQAAAQPAVQPAPAQPAPRAAAQPSAPALAQPASASSQYVVKRGDTLWDIAQRFTGDPFNYRNLAGRNLIHDPDLIFPGQIIQVESSEKK